MRLYTDVPPDPPARSFSWSAWERSDEGRPAGCVLDRDGRARLVLVPRGGVVIRRIR